MISPKARKTIYLISTILLSVMMLLSTTFYFTKHEMVVKEFTKLGFPTYLMTLFLIVPAFIRNWVYDFIAKNRYKWYGKKEACMIPTPELKSKFLA